MSVKEKLLSRFWSMPSDVTFDMHKPHPGNVVKKGTLKGVGDYLATKELI